MKGQRRICPPQLYDRRKGQDVMKYGQLTYQEIRDAASRSAIAVIPTGCTEQRGPHLPVDVDTWFAETVCVAASERAWSTKGVESLVLPLLPFGPTPEH